MKTFLATLLVIAGSALTLTGCQNGISASGLGKATEFGMVIAGEDPERASRVGGAVGRTVGSTARMPEETEVTLGESIALRSIARFGNLHPDESLQRYVNLVGLTVARVSERPGLPWVFGVVESDQPSGWACPGGFVFVTSAAVAAMDDEAELAAILAHEVGHVTRRHMATQIRRTEFFSGLTEIGAVATDQDMENLSRAVDSGMNTLFDRGFDRAWEYEADAVGVELAAAAGYDPAGLRRYLQRIARDGSGGGAWLRSTHPPVNERLQRMDAILGGGLDELGGARASDRFQRQTAVLRAQ